MTIKEVAEKIGKTKWAVYKMIKQKRGVGKKFKKNRFGVYEVDGRKVK